MASQTHLAIGPVDIAAIVFEGNQFNGQVAPALAQLQDSGIVRILDVALVIKDEKDDVAVLEVEDSDVADLLSAIAGERVDLLNDADLIEVGAGLATNCSALVIVWENSWAANFAKAVADSGGVLVSYDRIPAPVLQAAFAALEGE